MNNSHSLDNFEASLFRVGKSKNTVRIYTNIVRQFLDLNYADPIEWLIESRNSGASPATLKSRTAALKAWTRFTGDAAADAALCAYKLPTVGAPTPHPVPGGIVVVRAVLGTVTDRRVRLLIALGALAGLRVAESLAVTGQSWDRAAQALRITGKGGKTRVIPVSTELEAILLECAPKNPREKMVGLQDRWAREKITEAFSNIGVRHGNGDSITSHDLRATFATELYEQSSRDLVLVQRLLGHSSVAQTQQYLGLADSRVRNGVNFA
ncbi:integrase [Gordonia phage Jumbo]|uniref:Integrase n=1 Tax=Gordonia phage Jumbo TaxID=1887650 RepID=A0A1B3B0M5_9CAUD|nr:integrase [Gordonia phage Jumbo]AOE44577.1 integrase [Gordonia phage Jumbo]